MINQLQREVAKVLQLPELAERLAGSGAVAVASTPEQFAALIRKEQAQYAAIIMRAGIRVV